MLDQESKDTIYIALENLEDQYGLKNVEDVWWEFAMDTVMKQIRKSPIILPKPNDGIIRYDEID